MSLLLGLGLFFLALCSESQALEYYWGSHPDKERLVLRFQQGLPDTYTIERSNSQEVSILLQEQTIEQESWSESTGNIQAEILADISLNGNQIRIQTRTSAFGYVHFELPEEDKLVLDFFQDELGSVWSMTQHTETEQARPDRASSASSPRNNQDQKAEGAEEALAQEEPAIEDDSPSTQELSFNPILIQPELSSVTAKDKSAQDPHIFRGKVRQDSLPEPREQTEEEPDDSPETAPQEEPLEQSEQDLEFTPIPTELSQEELWQESLFQARAALANRDFQVAKEILGDLLQQDLEHDIKAEALYLWAETLFQENSGKRGEHFGRISQAFDRVLNHDPQGEYVPDALLRLVALNLQVDNGPEARGYFNLLRERFPEHGAIPAGHVLLGNHYLDSDRFEQAAEHFQTVVEDYSQSKKAKPAAMGLAQALRELEFFEQAWETVKFLENRWPRYYLEDPEFLQQAGLIAQKNDKPAQAKDYFWHFYNLYPQTDDADLVLARIGDSYLEMDKKQDAKEIYEETAQRFPDQEGGLIAKMRLAEEGIFDEPSREEMFSVFDNQYTLRPAEVYNEILEDHPESPLAPLALLKLAMWQLWEKKNQEALQSVRDFEERFSQSELRPRAMEVGRKALDRLLEQAVQNEYYARAVNIWQENSFLHEEQEKVQPETRLAAALALWKTERTEQALEVAGDLLQQEDILDENYHQGLELALNIYLQNQSWTEILDISEQAQDKELPSKLDSRLNYARALALQNLGREEKSSPLWQDLAVDEDLSEQQQGYAYYFLAQNELERQNWENVYNYAQSALSLFMENEPKKMEQALDCLDMLIEITRRSGRDLEAIQWAQEYQELIDQDSERWAAHKYRLAELYQEAGDKERWEDTLQNLQSEQPDSRYGQLAASALEEEEMEQRASEFLQ
ncbi:MAG: tetratricopeptide repeat protein [Thermodesulfobacteriota bacterium]